MECMESGHIVLPGQQRVRQTIKQAHGIETSQTQHDVAVVIVVHVCGAAERAQKLIRLAASAR